MGGNAITSCDKIKRENLKDILDDFFNLYQFLTRSAGQSHRLVGSTGSTKPILGDIDIAFNKTLFDIQAFDYQNLGVSTLEYVLKRLQIYNPDLEFYLNRGANIISIAHYFKPLNEKYQIDIILSSHMDFTSWMLFSPPNDWSKYKGLYRNSLISACTHFLGKNIMNEGIFESRYLLNYSTGLYRVMQRTTSEKTGKPLKRPKEVDRMFITKDPDTIIGLLFARELDTEIVAKKFMTFEATLGFLHMTQEKEVFDQIVEKHIQYLTKNNYELPEQYENFTGK